mmetsp:Transcript_15802/g.35578  ORF Transcript_15802/g.35578 Transcript_15802/m.35578 type:complete len:83 (-) Transcript_15802:465-713(-)
MRVFLDGSKGVHRCAKLQVSICLVVDKDDFGYQALCLIMMEDAHNHKWGCLLGEGKERSVYWHFDMVLACREFACVGMMGGC